MRSVNPPRADEPPCRLVEMPGAWNTGRIKVQDRCRPVRVNLTDALIRPGLYAIWIEGLLVVIRVRRLDHEHGDADTENAPLRPKVPKLAGDPDPAIGVLENLQHVLVEIVSV